MNLRKQISQVTSFRLVNSLQRSIVLSSNLKLTLKPVTS